MAATNNMSEGEIYEGLSDISSEEDIYFENLKKLTNRKLELELENSIVFEQIAGNGKENHYSNRRPSRRKRLKSISRYEAASRDVPRSRSYRSSSILSNYTIKKRKKVRSTFRKSNKPKRLKQQFKEPELSDDERAIEQVIELDESSDEELLKLRLNALKSKQEVKELINEEEEASLIKPFISKPSEEEDLRILALRSAVLKKKDFYKERKKQKMMENERPYSPSDDLPPLALDDDDVMVLSPLGSPFNEIEVQREEMDMDISNSPTNYEKELSDMDIAPSPSGVVEEIQTTEDNDEEVALRFMLLTSISNKKKSRSPLPDPPVEDNIETKRMAQNLLLAVQRLKLQRKLVSTPAKKSGSKTIAMILEESKSKKKIKLEKTQQEAKPEVLQKVKEISTLQEDSPADINESFLIRTITNDLMIPAGIPEQHIAVESEVAQLDQDSSFSTITDTKNIPILPAKAKQSRLITSLDTVKKPVSRLVIKLGQNSDTDEDEKRQIAVKKTTRRIAQSPKSSVKSASGFERNLDSFLKSIRDQLPPPADRSSPASIQPSTLVPDQPTSLTKVSSSVKHLPLSSQIEYEQLLQKMKVLEEAKLNRALARQSKRTKSSSLPVEKPTGPTMKSSPQSSLSKKASTVAQAEANNRNSKSLDKISDSLRKIPQLEESAQQRLIEKAEINFKNHSNNLLVSTEENLKLLEENEADIKRKERLQTHIADLELLMKKYKSNLAAVDQRVKVNIHKIVQSQRTMITVRTRQRNFGKICQQVGVMIRGKDYSLPEHQSTEVEENLVKIAAMTDGILKVTTDQKVRDYIKLVADRVKSLSTIKVPAVQENSSTLWPSVANKESSAKEATVDSLSIPNENNEEESEVSKMLRENVESLVESVSTPEEVIDKEVKFPVIQRTAMKGRVLEEGSSTKVNESEIIVKKLKYESPLEFLRLPKNNKKPPVNKILCPYHLEGTCSDEKCKMMHI